MDFKIGMRIPPKLNEQGIAKVAHWASEVGIDVLDVSILTPQVRKSCDETGIEIGTVDAQKLGQLLSENENTRAEALESLKKQITETSSLGGRTMFMCLVPENPNLARSKGFEIWKEIFPDLVRHAEQLKVYLAIEGWPGGAPHYNALGCTPEMLRAMFNVVPSKYLGICYDPSHLLRLGIDYLRFLREFGEKVIHCHGKDTEILEEERYEYGNLSATFGSKYRYSDGSWRYTIPGHGLVEWSKIAIQLERIGYQGPISIELEDHRYWGTVEAEQQGIMKSLQHLMLYFK